MPRVQMGLPLQLMLPGSKRERTRSETGLGMAGTFFYWEVCAERDLYIATLNGCACFMWVRCRVAQWRWKMYCCSHCTVLALWLPAGFIQSLCLSQQRLRKTSDHMLCPSLEARPANTSADNFPYQTLERSSWSASIVFHCPIHRCKCINKG